MRFFRTIAYWILLSALCGPGLGNVQPTSGRHATTDSPLLESIESDWGTPAFAKHFLGYDQKNRNDSVTQTGSLYGRYGIGLSTRLDYSDRNEVLNARTEISNSPQTAGTELQGRGFGYLYDPAGNRTGSRFRDEPVLPYVPNALNQYASRGRPDVVPVSGLVEAAATVTVDSQTVPAANRQNDYFHYLRPRSGPAQEIVVRATLSNPNRVAEERRTVIAPGTTETFQNDLDGNLTQDEQWDYTYDGENRLIAMATRDLGGSVVRKRLEFVYDYLGRRVEKKVSTRLNTTPVTWRLDLDLRFVYQGWTLVAELDALTDPSSPTLVRSYVHGLDISGSFQGAAGVGGLLGMLTHTGSPHVYYAANDARGNVIGLLDGQTGTMAAQYEYGAFGERLGAGGPMAGVNGLQFSSKYYDPETELCNFGFRYYNPSLGRFINRDPQNELGRIQLVSFGGRGVQVWSYLGLASANGAEAAQKQDASLQNTSLPHSNEQVSAGPKNSLIPGMTDFSKKGYSVGAAAFRTPTLSLGGDNSYYAPYQSGMGNDVGGDANLYAYVGNSPYSAIDPLGLWGWNWLTRIGEGIIHAPSSLWHGALRNSGQSRMDALVRNRTDFASHYEFDRNRREHFGQPVMDSAGGATAEHVQATAQMAAGAAELYLQAATAVTPTAAGAKALSVGGSAVKAEIAAKGAASLIPESYMNSRLLVNMEPARNLVGSTLNASSQVRNANYFWQQLIERAPQMFSKGNLYRIQKLGLSPRVDPTWVKYNPTHQNFRNEVLHHHHLNQGPVAAPLPQSVHEQWTSVLHEY